jgi:type IV pilus assembly protein PilC
MQKVANFYDDELDRKIGNLATIMEPFILFFIAGIVIFMILAIFLPILGMNDKLLETFLPMTSFV